MELPVKYFTLPKPKDTYVSARSLSEQLAKRRLHRMGYKVSRGSQLDCFFERTNFDYSPTAVFVRYKLIKSHSIKTVTRMAKYCTRHHGTPDLIAAHSANGVLAIEVKLGHERIAPHQLETMRRLQQWGLKCEVWRMMPAKNIVREKQINLASWSQTGDLRTATQKLSYDDRLKKRYPHQRR